MSNQINSMHDKAIEDLVVFVYDVSSVFNRMHTDNNCGDQFEL